MAKNETYHEMLLREERSYLSEIAQLEAQTAIEQKDLADVREELWVYQETGIVPQSFLDLITA